LVLGYGDPQYCPTTRGEQMRMIYVAAVEVQTTRSLDAAEAMKVLADYRPALGTSSRGWVEVEITFPATGLAHACAKASALARAATGAEPIAAHVMTQQEYSARLAPGTGSEGRHSAEERGKGLVLPRQATDAWDSSRRSPGRHSA
jgi:hypothetical protein